MKGVEMTRGLLALAVAALAVMCLGMITITSQRTELLVGSFVPHKDKMGQTASAPHGYGNQAASHSGQSSSFYNAAPHVRGTHKARVGQKRIVGSYPVYRDKQMPQKSHKIPLSHMIGDQIHNSIIKPKHPYFHGMRKLEARKAAAVKNQKLMIGSYKVDPKSSKTPLEQPKGIGNQAAPHFGNAAGFFNHAARKPRNVRTNKLLVGSFPVNAQQPGYKVPGIGNEAVPAHSHFDVGTNIVFHGVKSEGGIKGATKKPYFHGMRKIAARKSKGV